MVLVSRLIIFVSFLWCTAFSYYSTQNQPSDFMASTGTTQEKILQKLTQWLPRITFSQNYKVVRRSQKNENLHQLQTVQNMVLSPKHPWFVWENLGNQYQYQLIVGETVYSIPAGDNPIIRVKINPFEGMLQYRIRVLSNRGPVFEESEDQEKRSSTGLIRWQKSEEPGMRNSLFTLGEYFEQQHMWVAAMDHYKGYMQTHPDEFEITPYLLRTYKKLKLSKAYERELQQYKSDMLR